MLTPRSKKKGIEVSHWKVSDADDFRGLDTGADTDIEPGPPEDYVTENPDGFSKVHDMRGEAEKSKRVKTLP